VASVKSKRCEAGPVGSDDLSPARRMHIALSKTALNFAIYGRT
jgi:hypothetical protein